MNKELNQTLFQGDQTEVVCISKNNVVVKEVSFLGDKLLVVKDEETNKVYTGVGYICKGIGLSQGQINNEVNKVKNDVLLSKGSRNLVTPTKGGNQEVLAIDIDYLPIWLAKISITPKMKEKQPELVERLINYQLKAKDVLASVFVHKLDPLAGASPELRAILMQDEKIQEVESRLDDLEDNIHITRSQQRKLKDFANKVVISELGSKHSNAYKTFSGKAFSSFWRDYKNRFDVASYLDTPKLNFQEALQFINDWKPDAELKYLIIGANTYVQQEIAGGQA